MTDQNPEAPQKPPMAIRPWFLAAAAVSAAVCAQQCYRYLRPRRPKWKSKSRKPQISRWESEGGDVPQVQALGTRGNGESRTLNTEPRR